MRDDEASGVVSLFIVILFVLFLVLINPVIHSAYGVHGWGPVRDIDHCRIIGKHIDNGKDESHYMITSDKGTFEVANGVWVKVWNADAIYGGMEVGKFYNIKTRGNEVLGIWFQEYPYVLKVEESKNE